MPIRVLVVDDSAFFRRRVTEMLSCDSQIEVVGHAVDGAEAVEKVSTLKPDVVTMDVEMPVMDGITAVKRIMSIRPTPVLMFSSLTTEGAKATLDALDAGALDFLPKRFEDISQDKNEARQLLVARVRALGARSMSQLSPKSSPAGHASPSTSTAKKPPAAIDAGRGGNPLAGKRREQFKLLAIGTSTGGPVALQEVLTKLPANFPLPLVIVQHMPAAFTPAFAERLDRSCAITVKEAKDGDALIPGTALLAPGGMQMVTEIRGGRAVVKIMDAQPGQTYKPCVDITLSAVARIYPGQVLAIIMTGMGADGREGARALKQGGSVIWAQDESSCVVYGMPMAVVDAGLTDYILSLNEIGPMLAQKLCY